MQGSRAAGNSNDLPPTPQIVSLPLPLEHPGHTSRQRDLSLQPTPSVGLQLHFDIPERMWNATLSST